MNLDGTITLAYGSGGELYHQLVEEIFLPAFDNPILSEMSDSGICKINATNIAMTTDSYVVKPRFFPGGDIGKLAVCGTVNDLAMSGAKPLYLTVGMIIEAGFSCQELNNICLSMAQAAKEAGVIIVSGDTKVVDQGACDGIFINTAGIGIVENATLLSPAKIKIGDKIIVSGNIASHGMAIMTARYKLEFDPPIMSDVASLNTLAEAAMSVDHGVLLMRDPTRGGIASTLNEWSKAIDLPIFIEEKAVPLSNEVEAACDLLGIDPLYVANEGKLLAVVDATLADEVLAKMLNHPLGQNSSIIGEIGREGDAGVYACTSIGSKRVIGMIDGEQLPRIC